MYGGGDRYKFGPDCVELMGLLSDLANIEMEYQIDSDFCLLHKDVCFRYPKGVK